MQMWHMREETFRAALGCLTDAIHVELLAEWFGGGVRASGDGQAFNLGGPGEAGGQVNAHYGRDPIVKIYTTITDRFAPLHQRAIAGTAGEAAHPLDGLLGHDSNIDICALYVDGGGVSDIISGPCTCSASHSSRALRACPIAGLTHLSPGLATVGSRRCSASGSLAGPQVHARAWLEA